MVIWVTGLSGAGKTTLCQAIYRLLKPRLPELVLLDGDVVRAILSQDLGYRESDRIVQVKRIQGLAKCLSDQGVVVLVAALYSHPELLAWNREHFQDYVEVYLKASLETVRRRDPKALYAKASVGTMPHVVGMDIPWHEPVNPDLVINSDESESPESLAKTIVASVPRLAHLVNGT